MAVLLPAACLGCSGGSSGVDNVSPAEPMPTDFDVVYERQLTSEEAGGILAPSIKAALDTDGHVQMVFFTSSTTLDTTGLPPDSDLIANPYRFNIVHGVWDPATEQLMGSEEILDVTPPYTNDSPVVFSDQGTDNCSFLGLDFVYGNIPLVVYQGGARPQSEGGLSCNSFYQGDLMVSLKSGGVWEEAIGIQGDASVKNPLFTDGMIGVAGGLAVDSIGNIHMIAQHYYESCDLHGTTFPDLVYVVQAIDDLNPNVPGTEEWVDEHNTYGAGGGIQNALGYHCKLVLDPDEQPVAVYFGTMADGQRVLRASTRVSGVWQAETIAVISNDYTVGHISAAVASDGTLSVAYFMRSISDDAEFGDHLRYAEKRPGESWNITLVDYASYCGNYCALALDTDERPAIVYYDERPYTAYRERYDVKLAHFDGRYWQKEIAATDGQIGLYNSLWFNHANVAHICTYDQETNRIVLLRRK